MRCSLLFVLAASSLSPHLGGDKTLDMKMKKEEDAIDAILDAEAKKETKRESEKADRKKDEIALEDAEKADAISVGFDTKQTHGRFPPDLAQEMGVDYNKDLTHDPLVEMWEADYKKKMHAKKDRAKMLAGKHHFIAGPGHEKRRSESLLEEGSDPFEHDKNELEDAFSEIESNVAAGEDMEKAARRDAAVAIAKKRRDEVVKADLTKQMEAEKSERWPITGGPDAPDSFVQEKARMVVGADGSAQHMRSGA